MKRSLRNRIVYTIALLLLIAGVGILAYPCFSDCWNRYVSYKSIVEYTNAYNFITEEERNEMLEQATAYNKELLHKGKNYISECVMRLSGSSQEAQLKGEVLHPDREYESLLSKNGSDMMGFLSIPKIGVDLPIRHYTSEDVLSSAIGHVYGSSLPVGGESTHAVLAGHSALSSARLFTDLEKMEIDDEFTITTAGDEKTYRIDQILTVLPEDLSALSIKKGKDYVTLVTCTPYGINSHRLLVRGKRVLNEQAKESGFFGSKSNTTPWYITHFMWMCLGLGIALITTIVLALKKIWKRKAQTE